MSLYADVWDACYAQVLALPVFADMHVIQRREPAFVQGQDRLPAIVVAPRSDLAEQLVDERFEKGADILFEIYVGIAVLGEWDLTQARWRMQAREDIRLTLARFDLLARTTGGEPGAIVGQFDMEYSPAPEVPHSGWENVLETWQRFDVIVSTQRSN